MNPALPLRLVDNKFSIQAFGHPFERKGKPAHILGHCEGYLFALGILTHWNQEHMINFVILWQDKAIVIFYEKNQNYKISSIFL